MEIVIKHLLFYLKILNPHKVTSPEKLTSTALWLFKLKKEVLAKRGNHIVHFLRQEKSFKSFPMGEQSGMSAKGWPSHSFNYSCCIPCCSRAGCKGLQSPVEDSPLFSNSPKPPFHTIGEEGGLKSTSRKIVTIVSLPLQIVKHIWQISPCKALNPTISNRAWQLLMAFRGFKKRKIALAHIDLQHNMSPSPYPALEM